jgi:uncharacterized protein YjbI with pentapeptide repeats
VTGRDEQKEEETVEVVHESLIREWQTLCQWVEANRSFRTWQERLEGSRRQWESTGKDDGALLRGVPLVEAELWQEERQTELSERQRIFIQLSLALRDREKKERESQQQRITVARTLAICFLIAFLGLVVFFFRDWIKLAFMSANRKHLAGRNLAKEYLPGVDFSDGNLSQANLVKTYMQKANLQGANLTKTFMKKANLSQTNLSYTNLSEANSEEANLSRAKLNGVRLVKTYMPQAHLQDADLSQADFSEANIDGSDLSGANLQGAKNLNPDQVKRAKNWDKARYDEEFRQKLGLK